MASALLSSAEKTNSERTWIYLPKSFNLMLQCDLIGQFMAWWFVFNQLKQSSLSHAIFLLSCVCFDLNTGQKATWCLCLQMTEFFYLKGFSSPALCSVIGISLALHMTSHGCCSEHQGKFLLVWQVDLTWNLALIWESSITCSFDCISNLDEG